MSRLSKYLRNQADLRKGSSAYPIKLTPGQLVELTQELGYEPSTFSTFLGEHPIVKIHTHTKATGDNVILAPRDDLFTEVERDTGVELICLANEVTSVPDNIASCEIISVGELVTNVKVGDVAFIDFYDVKQGYVLENETLFIAGSDAFRALFDPKTQTIVPLDNYVVTRRASKRFKVALTGTDRVEVLDYILTDGIPGGKNSSGITSTHILYEEVVAVGKVTTRARPGVMTPAERKLLDLLSGKDSSVDDGSWLLHVEDLEALRNERSEGRESDVSPGELVMFCKEISTPVRVRGEFQHIIPLENVLAVIDDGAILDEKVKAGKAGQIVISPIKLVS